MRILLVNPPIALLDSAAKLKDLDDQDNSRVPIGLYSLAALMIEAGHETRLANLALTPEREALQEIVEWKPDLLGFTMFSYNAPVAQALARQARKARPNCRIVLGGVHVTFLYEEILKRWAYVDFVAVGEAENSFSELVARLARGDSTEGIPGIAGRRADGSLDWVGLAEPVADLSQLPIPAKYFKYDIVSTSRGCPGNCSFCCSPGMWGRRVRERSVAHVLEELRLLRNQHGLTQVMFKDETFTARPTRVRELCQAMVDEQINLWWTCDTRVDCLDEERLYWMRKAGCFLVSLGVESGSERLLRDMGKGTNLEKIRRSSLLARQFGMQVRFYMIVGLPDEKPEDLQASVDLIEACKPNYVFTATLTVSPGTRIWDLYQKRFHVNDSMWFTSGRKPLIEFDATNKYQKVEAGRKLVFYPEYLKENPQQENLHPHTEAELRWAQERLADCFAPNYDLALFLKKEGRFAEAVPFLAQALRIRPTFDKGWIDLGECYDRQGELDQALVCWHQAVVTEGISPQNLAISLFYLGLGLEAKGDLEGAMGLWKRAFATFPTYGAPVQRLAERCVQLGRWADAQDATTSWTNLEPESGPAWHHAALTALGLGLADVAQAHFEKALNLMPDNPEVYCDYAVLMAQAGLPGEALKIVETCLQIAPGFPRALEFEKNLQSLLKTTS
jgi:radical SAM superfamily enzyme YgiQ (UPF0313 family)/thioredoxin-like negative regulator of GroEL